MKNKFKFLGIIAMVAVIGFTMTACLTVGTSGDSGSATAESPSPNTQASSGGGAGSVPAMEWPSDADWGRFGLSGLRQPPGDYSITGHQTTGFSSSLTIMLLDADKAVYDNLVGQVRGISGLTLMGENTEADGSAGAQFMRQTMTSMTLVAISYNFADNIIIITVS